jgi:rfaE bifunctional protein nucleotidyltransferase chain/domain
MYTSAQKIFDLADVVPRLTAWRLKNERIVFTNGCFDILHLGHVDYLEKARRLGDRLVLGLNTDASVFRIKGPSRPVQSEMSRARVVAALEFVDMVVLFDEETPLELIQLVRPDVLVKGDDYSVDTIVGAKEVMAWGGSVQTVPLVEGHSTTRIIEKLKQD